MKNLATCVPSEFLKQTNRIRKCAERWLKVTDIMNIRKRMPKGLPELTDNLSKEEFAEVQAKRDEMMAEQVMANLSAILDELIDNHPEETIELLALCCFVEPEDADNHTMSEYLSCIYELIQDRAVQDFFRLLMS